MGANPAMTRGEALINVLRESRQTRALNTSARRILKAWRALEIEKVPVWNLPT
jgi:hypothetical protein